MKLHLTLGYALLLFWGNALLAQTAAGPTTFFMAEGPVPPGPINIGVDMVDGGSTLISCDVGDTKVRTFTAIPGPGVTLSGNCNWTVSDPELGLTFSGANNTICTLTYQPTSAVPCATPQNVTLSVTNSGIHSGSLPLTYCANAPTCDATTPVDIVLVVDVSGSMGDGASCATAGESKLTYLKNKMMALYDNIGDHFMRAGTDRFGLVTFHTVDVAPVPMPLQLVSGTTRSTLAGFMDTSPPTDGLQPLDWTGMGAGLHRAITMLNTAPPPGLRKKVIILVTNGAQNEPPMVNSDGSGIAAGGGFPTAVTFGSQDIKIVPYAIFSPSESYMTLLNGILSHSGATEYGLSTSPLVCDIDPSITEAWIGALRSICSPKLVEFKRGQLFGAAGQETFTVKESMSRMTVSISASGAHDFSSFKVEKTVDGTLVDLTPYGEFTPPLGTPSKHRVFKVDFPIAAAPSGFSTVGEYKASFGATMPNLTYDFSVIVDDQGLRQRFFANGIAPAGDRYYLGAHLLQDNTPITNANVKAVIYAPDEPLGRVFARKRVPSQFISVSNPFWGKTKYVIPYENGYAGQPGLDYFGGPKGGVKSDAYIKQFSITHPTLNSFKAEGDKMQNGEKKYLVLMYETDFKDVFNVQPIATIPLKHVGNGVYRAAYDGFKKTGLYQVRFIAEGNTSVAGDFKRFEDKSTLVRFGTPDPRRSDLCLLYDEPPVLTMRPVDTEGNMLGPNQLAAIDLRVDGAQIKFIADYLDGRYVAPLNGSTPDPKVTIRIHGRLLYDGPMSGLCGKRGYAEITGGVATPVEAFDQKFNSGWAVQGRLGYRVWKQLGIQAKASYAAFKDEQTGGTDHGILGLGGGLSYRYWLNVLYGMYAQADVNAMGFKPKSAKWAFGLNYGLALTKPLNHCLYLTLRADYHDIQTTPDRTRFLSYGTGLQVRF